MERNGQYNMKTPFEMGCRDTCTSNCSIMIMSPCY